MKKNNHKYKFKTKVYHHYTKIFIIYNFEIDDLCISFANLMAYLAVPGAVHTP